MGSDGFSEGLAVFNTDTVEAEQQPTDVSGMGFGSPCGCKSTSCNFHRTWSLRKARVVAVHEVEMNQKLQARTG